MSPCLGTGECLGLNRRLTAHQHERAPDSGMCGSDLDRSGPEPNHSQRGLLGFHRVVNCLSDDLAVFDEIGINPVSDSDLGVFVSPLEKGNPPLCSHVGVMERLMLWQLVGEHPRKLPYTLVAPEYSPIDEDDNVFNHVAAEILVEDPVEGLIHPAVGDVEVIIEHLPCRSLAQVVHEKSPSG